MNTPTNSSTETITHTPAPWESFKDRFGYGSHSIGVPSDVGMKVIATVDYDFDEPWLLQQHANARLIAAAPDLLALAKKLAGECSECEGVGVSMCFVDNDPNDITKGCHAEPLDCDDCADIRKVIAKAEGRS